TTAHGAYAVPRLPTIKTDPDGAEQALTAQLVEPLVPTLICKPTVLPDVQLHQIVAVETCVLKTLVDFTFGVIGRERVFNRVCRACGPLQILGRNLGGGVEPRVRVGADELA